MLISFSTYLYYVAMIKFHNKQNLSILLLNFYFILAIINKYIECKDIGKAISSVGMLFIICIVAFTVYVFWQSHKVLKNGDKVTFKNTVLVAKKVAKPGDVVLFSPASASFDMFKNFEERGNKFKELVNNL